jgi:D-serine deaminase-like pyridoxal phosphate-dependent protein
MLKNRFGDHLIEFEFDGIDGITEESSIPTPALVIDAPGLRRNLASMSAYATARDLKLRPHTKTHKSLEIARLQLEFGDFGLTVAKVSEASVMLQATDDLLLAYPVADPLRACRVAEIARLKTVRVAMDSAQSVQMLSNSACSAGVTIGVLVDIDVGFHRTGVQTPEASLALALEIDASPGLRLDGLFCFPGHIVSPPSQQEQELATVSNLLQRSIDLWKQHGLAASIVSGGSTPTAYQSHLISQLTEIRPGTYVFNDMNTVRGQFCTLGDCSARIVATIVSNAVPGQVVIDAGSKTLTQDHCIAAADSGYGYVVEYPDAKITTLNEEHGLIDIRSCQQCPTIGERISIIPNHICPCINLQDYAWWLEPGEAPRAIGIDARGRSV